MSELTAYLDENAFQGEEGADLIFFKVKAKSTASAEKLKSEILAHKGVFNEVDLFDGNEHGYIELGGWIGDQGYALMLIGLGAELGMWQLLTPYTVMGKDISPELAMRMAGSGLVTMKFTK